MPAKGRLWPRDDNDDGKCFNAEVGELNCNHLNIFWLNSVYLKTIHSIIVFPAMKLDRCNNFIRLYCGLFVSMNNPYQTLTRIEIYTGWFYSMPSSTFNIYISFGLISCSFILQNTLKAEWPPRKSLKMATYKTFLKMFSNFFHLSKFVNFLHVDQHFSVFFTSQAFSTFSNEINQ